MTVAEKPARSSAARSPAEGLAMRNGRRGSGRRSGLVHEIAARRAADVSRELGSLTFRELARRASGVPPPRDVVLPLARPGIHLIAEVKRASPSAGRIAAPGDDPVVRARAYQAGGATAISVLCEPHWFGGSPDDVTAVRAAVSVPVLAKEFVVDERQLPALRAAGADAVLLLAVLHPGRRLAKLVAIARDLGLEALVEAHDERELERGLATGAGLIGINNRDLGTLEVDPERAARLRALVPEDRLAIAESGAHDVETIRGWRALGFDGALVGEALVRAEDPESAVRSFVTAGEVPSDPAAEGRIPFVKICGITDASGLHAALRAGADAIGLNLVPGTPRALELGEAAELARLARSTAGGRGCPRIVVVTVDESPASLTRIVEAVNPDAIQLSGDESTEEAARIERPVWKVLHLPRTDPPQIERAAADIVDGANAYLALPNCERIMLDTAGGTHPGGTGTAVAPRLSQLVARQVPVVLAGGLHAGTVGATLLATPAVGVDVASGVEERPGAGRRPGKDPLKVALFVKRARAARFDRPNVLAHPAPVHPGLLEADQAGRWGVDRAFGGRYVPETLVSALRELEAAYLAIREDPRFWADLRHRLATYAGRPTPLYRADRLAERLLSRAREIDPRASPERLALYLKREDLAHTGAHKINNALGQALLTKRLGKSRVIAETGAGQHGVATATACALLGLPCVVYMGAEDIERQQPTVLRMHVLGAEVRPVSSGSATLKDAINEAMRDWVTNVETTHYVLGSAMGPHPYPTLVRDLQRVIGDEAAVQLLHAEGRLPDLALACVGGGSNAIGLLSRFIGERSVRLAVAEAAGEGIETGRHAAAVAAGSPGILHGARSLMLQDRDGQVVEAHSLSAGLDYPGVGPQIAALAVAGRIELAAATDSEAIAALREVIAAEGILPALETAHAFAVLPRLLAGAAGERRAWPQETVVLLGLSGRGDKDLAALERVRAGA
jgi:tryptophan synthase beta subunit